MIAAQHRDRLKDCHEELIRRLGAAINELEGIGIKMMVAPDGGLRTPQEQRALYAKGRTIPGRIVTWCDGVRSKSKHQGGRAGDCCFRGPYPFDDNQPWSTYGAMVKKHGLEWGGDLPEPKTDRPHAQLPKSVK